MSAKGVDALPHTWDFPEVLYPFPPTLLLPAVLERIRATSRPVLLLAPAWSRQSWYRSLWSCQWRTQYVSRSNNSLPCRGISITHCPLRTSGTLGRCYIGMGLEDRDSLRVLMTSWFSCYGLLRVLSMTESGTSFVQRDRSSCLCPYRGPGGFPSVFMRRFSSLYRACV